MVTNNLDGDGHLRIESGIPPEMAAYQIALMPEHEAALEAALLSSVPSNTRRGYAGAWRRFARWCEQYRYPSLPADPRVLASYLLDLKREGKKLSTICFHRAAIVHHHKVSGRASPADNEEVRRAMGHLEKTLGSEQKQAMPMDKDAFIEVIRTAKNPRRRSDGSWEDPQEALRRGAGDIAIISVMRTAMLRASEAADLTWSDVRPWPDGTGRLHIRRSKTDQRGQGVTKYLGRLGMRHLAAIRPESCAGSEPVFRVGARQVGRRIKAAAIAAGLGDGFSGHSPRVGYTNDLSANGAGLPGIQHEGRWNDPRQVENYTRGQDAAKGPAAQFEAQMEAMMEAMESEEGDADL